MSKSSSRSLLAHTLVPDLITAPRGPSQGLSPPDVSLLSEKRLLWRRLVSSDTGTFIFDSVGMNYAHTHTTEHGFNEGISFLFLRLLMDSSL